MYQEEVAPGVIKLLENLQLKIRVGTEYSSLSYLLYKRETTYFTYGIAFASAMYLVFVLSTISTSICIFNIYGTFHGENKYSPL